MDLDIPPVDGPPPGLGPVVVGAQRTDILSAPAEWSAIFQRERSMVCPNFLDAQLLAAMLDSCRKSEFVEQHIDRLGTRAVETPQRLGGALNLILGRAPFLRWIESVTGCRSLTRVDGRLVQSRAHSGDQLDWHDDMSESERRLGITICLSDSSFEGGWFELRDAESGKLLRRHRHQHPGTALIFQVAPQLQHRLLPVTAGGPRRVFTGWFLGD